MIYLSYSRKDSAIAKIIFQILSIRNEEIFWDQINILPGDKWEIKNTKAIRESDIVVVCWCCHVDDLSYVQKELNIAKRNNKKIIPIKFCKCQLKRNINNYQWIDMSDTIKHICHNSSYKHEVELNSKADSNVIILLLFIVMSIILVFSIFGLPNSYKFVFKVLFIGIALILLLYPVFNRTQSKGYSEFCLDAEDDLDDVTIEKIKIELIESLRKVDINKYAFYGNK